MKLLEVYIKHVLFESVERKYKLNTIITKASQIIINQLKQFFESEDSKLVFELNKNDIPELLELDDLLVTVNIKKVAKLEKDTIIVSASYDDPSNKIELFIKIQSETNELHPDYILLIKSNLRHELEHTLQNVKQFLDTSGEQRKKYFEQAFEIEAHAAEFYYMLRVRGERAGLTKKIFMKLLNLFINSIQTLKVSDKNKFKKSLIAYMIERYPLVNKVMSSG